jgi:hypothetical protein
MTPEQLEFYFTPEELEQERQIMDQYDMEAALQQQGMDEQYEQLNDAEQIEQQSWFLENELLISLQMLGKEQVEKIVQKVLAKQ